MPNSTFTISATTATFSATIPGSSQEITEAERLQIVVLFSNETAWRDAVSLLTPRYHVHVPMSGNVVVDVGRGPGAGTLVISGIGTTTAILIELRRIRYLPNGRSIANATFLLTAAWS